MPDTSNGSDMQLRVLRLETLANEQGKELATISVQHTHISNSLEEIKELLDSKLDNVCNDVKDCSNRISKIEDNIKNAKGIGGFILKKLLPLALAALLGASASNDLFSSATNIVQYFSDNKTD